MKQKELDKLNAIACDICYKYIVSEEFNSSPVISISHKNIYIYGFYEWDEQAKAYNTDERELWDTKELSKWDIEDLKNDPETFIENLLSNYFIKP